MLTAAHGSGGRLTAGHGGGGLLTAVGGSGFPREREREELGGEREKITLKGICFHLIYWRLWRGTAMK